MVRFEPGHGRRRPGLRGTVGIALAVGVAGFASACGGSDDADTTAAAPAATSEAAAATSAAAPATSEAAPATSEAAPATSEAAPASSEAAAADPLAVQLKDGTAFALAPRIADKIAAGDTLNYVFSYQSSAIQGFSQQYKAGFEKTQADAKAILPNMSFKAIAPSVPGADPPQQIAQIKALADTDQIDCLSIEPADSDSMTSITNELIAKGIPVFTAGVTSNGNEFTNFTQVPDKEGRTAAQTVLDYMNANGLSFKTFAVSGGDPSQFWAQGRMKGFREGILEAIPDATFVTDETSALSVTYDPAKTLDAYKAFLKGAGKDVDVIENVDIGAGFAARAIEEGGFKGKKFSVGWNVTPDQVAAIKAGTQIALFDQKWPEQAGFGAIACATYLSGGGILPNTQELTVVTSENVDAVVEEQKKLVGEA